MHREINRSTARRALLALVLCAAVVSSTAPTHAQELPTGAARVVKKVQIMVLTGKSEIEYKVAAIVANNSSKFPQP